MTLPTTKTSEMAPRGRCPVKNIYQGPTPRVLFVCTAGLLRSPTLQYLATQTLGYNTRAVGANHEYALIPLTEQLVEWADAVVFVDKHPEQVAGQYIDLEAWKDKILTLDVPDVFGFGEDRLVDMWMDRYQQIIYEFVEKTQKGFDSNYD